MRGDIGSRKNLEYDNCGWGGLYMQLLIVLIISQELIPASKLRERATAGCMNKCVTK